MLEPIIENRIRKDLEIDPFRTEVVKEFSKNQSKFKKKYDFPLRHYSQTVIKFTPKKIQKILERLVIEPANKTVTVFGGYTGQFAEGLRSIGFSVIFTDPIMDYVERSKGKGFESYCYFVEELPGEIIGRSDLFATFECYMPFMNPGSSIYTTSRLLSAPYGFIFAESKRTREDLKKEGGIGQLKSQFKPFEDNYSIKRRFREHGDLRFYHFIGDESSHNSIITDCKVMKLLYDSSGSDKKTKIDSTFLKKISKKGKLSEKDVTQSIRRIMSVHWGLVPKSLQIYFPANEFSIFSKGFIFQHS